MAANETCGGERECIGKGRITTRSPGETIFHFDNKNVSGFSPLSRPRDTLYAPAPCHQTRRISYVSFPTSVPLLSVLPAATDLAEIHRHSLLIPPRCNAPYTRHAPSGFVAVNNRERFYTDSAEVSADVRCILCA